MRAFDLYIQIAEYALEAADRAGANHKARTIEDGTSDQRFCR
jgi:hypothetical protein